jgi:hypothetical protein
MKRLIYLQTNYQNSKTIRDKIFKQFAKEIKNLPNITIIKQLKTEPQVIIEFPDDKYQEIYEALIKLDTIEIIDSILPLEDKDDENEQEIIKIDDSDDEHLIKLKQKMKKYRK